MDQPGPVGRDDDGGASISMGRDEDREASHRFDGTGTGISGDPWRAPTTPSPANPRSGRRSPADDDLSFDVRTWVREEPADAGPTAAAAASLSGNAPPRGRAAIAAASSFAILLAGAGIAWMQRDATPAAAPAVATADDGAAAAMPAPAAVVTPAPVTEASRRSLVIAGPEQIGPTLAAGGVEAAQVQAAVSAAAAAIGGQPGELRLEYDLIDGGAAHRLTRLVATRDDGAGVILVAKPDGGFTSEALQAKLTTIVKVVRGEMDATSFYNAAVNAGITDSLISDFANAFSFDFDFQREIHPGDVFEGAFEQKVNPSGDAVGPPVLIYVSMQTQAKAKSLYRFLAPGDTEAGWYDGNGKSTVKALMKTPVDGARISSQFGFRVHPVLGFMKLHKGTDFAAPIGTPIYASGAATVKWAAMKGPNGNLTILTHDNGWETYYLHQSMFMPGVVPGARVSQGQKIGEIGTTGRSTGPHLHYEVHINGEAVDSMKIDTGTGKSLAGGALAAFRKERDRIDGARAQAAG